MMCLVALITLAIGTEASQGPSFLYVGDWGGHSDWIPTTLAEVTTSKGMSEVAKKLGINSIFLLGDNFYEHGVESVSSVRFQKTFEDVYTSELFGEIPFHIIAGNHDHLGDIQAQINYTSKSKRWSYPSMYYSLDFNWTSNSGEMRTLEIIMIDTVDLVGDHVDFSDAPLTGPRNSTCAAKQWAWLEQKLAASSADYLWVAGHYPIYSAGDDGTVDALVEQLLPLLKKHGAHYICGHDHFNQHLNMDGVHQFQNGMGMECCYGTKHLDTVPKEYIEHLISGRHGQGKYIGVSKPPPRIEGGFNAMEFGDDFVTITAMKEDGAPLYSTQVARRHASVVI